MDAITTSVVLRKRKANLAGGLTLIFEPAGSFAEEALVSVAVEKNAPNFAMWNALREGDVLPLVLGGEE